MRASMPGPDSRSAVDARLAAPGEDLVHQLRTLLADEVQQLVGELPVALGPERFAGGGDAVAAAGPARAATLVAVGDQAFAIEGRQVLPDGTDGHAEAAGDLLGGGFAGLLDCRENAAPAFALSVEADADARGLSRRELDRLRRLARRV